MSRRAQLQMTASKGELDPDLSERVDLEHYYDSLASAPNTVFHPQGGFSDRGGLALVSDADILAAGTRRRLRRKIAPVRITSANVTAANGGDVALLLDQDTTTAFQTNAVTTTPFVALEIDLLSAMTVDFVDVLDFLTESASADNCLGVEYWNGSAWTVFADPIDTQPRKHVRTTARRRRFGTAPGGPGGTRVTARQWRITLVGATGVGRFSIGNVRLWAETSEHSAIDLQEVARARGASYELVVTERNIDVFAAQRYVASIPLPAANQQIGEITYSSAFDTLMLFHEMIETTQIVRQGSPGEWNISAAPFEDVPDIQDQIVFAGDQDEIQRLTLTGVTAGHVLHLALGDLIAAPITFSSAAALPAQIVTALDGLPGVAGGSSILATLQSSSPVTVDIRFTASNGLRAWPLVSVMSTAAVTSATEIMQAGLQRTSGKLFSATTGWPRCGSLDVQQRLLLAGFRAAPTSFMFSRPNIWNFLTTSDPMTADLAFLRTLNANGIETITSVFVGRHLQIFTEAGEWYAASATFDATQPTAVVRATSHGMRRAVPLAFADGATLFVQQSGQTLRDFLWRDAEQSYAAEPLNVLSPQILSDVIDVAHRSARSVTDGNQVFLVNADGTAGCLTLLRGQNVVAGSPWSIDGEIKAALCDVDHQVYFVTERDGERWLERWTPDIPLDFATTVTGSGMTSVTNADHLEGRDDVWAFADGDILGPFTVADGAFELGVAADEVTYGLMPTWSIRTQVLRGRINAEQPFRPPGRIYEVEIAMRDTGHLTLGTNGGTHAEVPLLRAGDRFRDGGPLQTATGGAPDLPMLERLYTGNVRVGGLIGVSKHPYIELGRTMPAPVHVKSIRLEIAMPSGGG